MDYSLGQIFGGAAIVFVVGILIVFLALAVIILILVLMANIFKAVDKKKAGETPAATNPAPAPAVNPAPAPAPVVEIAGEDDEEEIAAVIAAVVAMMSESGNGLVVRSVRRVGKNTPVWSASGRQEYMDTRY